MMAETDPPTVNAQIVWVTMYVSCPCGFRTQHEIDCSQGDDGAWVAPMEERFILCESCDQLIDAGLRLSVGNPE